MKGWAEDLIIGRVYCLIAEKEAELPEGPPCRTWKPSELHQNHVVSGHSS